VPGTFSDPSARAYYERLVRDVWDQGIHFSLLIAGPRVVAYHIGITSHGFLMYLKPTFDQELQSFSPGKLHLRFLLADAVARGLRGIDFLQGSEDYKGDWSTDVTRCSTFVVRTRRRSASFAWLTRGRPWSERVLGGVYNRWATGFQKILRRR
jgi:CelD/BcsL family acetyltransferase involved in cellulose biosynthesis